MKQEKDFKGLSGYFALFLVIVFIVGSVLTIIYGTYDYYVAWAVLTNQYSTLFNMGPIDKNIQSQKETIVLNYKSKVRLAHSK